MIELRSNQRAVLKLIFSNIPDTVIISCIQGNLGRAWTDNITEPRLAMIYACNYCFLAGDRNHPDAEALVTNILRLAGVTFTHVISDNPELLELTSLKHIGHCTTERRFRLKNPNNSFDTAKLRSIVDGLPDNYTLSSLEGKWYDKASEDEWSSDFIRNFASREDYEARALGKIITYGDEIVCAAGSFSVYYNDTYNPEDSSSLPEPLSPAGIEVNIGTRPEYRRKGLAKIAGAALILECCRRGIYPAWDAANPTSLHIAEELGYQKAGSYEALSIFSEGAERSGGIITLIGSPVSHSQSPMLFNHAFSRDGLNYLYSVRELTDEAEVRCFFDYMRMNGDLGCNVTMPFKHTAALLVNELKGTARLTDAVNTVVNDNGHLTGYSTDGIGLINALQSEGVSVEGSRIAIFGSGGAARAVISECAIAGASGITVICREGTNRQRTVKLTQQLQCEAGISGCSFCFTDFDNYSLDDIDILINCTPVGMAPDAMRSPLKDISKLHRKLVVADAVYNPQETLLIKQAKEAGCKTADGLLMLRGQAEAGYEFLVKNRAVP